MRLQYKIIAEDSRNVLYRDAIDMIKQCETNDNRIYDSHKRKIFDGVDHDENTIKSKLKSLNEEYSKLSENSFDQVISENIFEQKSLKLTAKIQRLETRLKSMENIQRRISMFDIRFHRFLDSSNDIPLSSILAE